jgi:hypothetical protein
MLPHLVSQLARLTSARQSGTLRRQTDYRAGVMMRIRTAAIWVAFAGVLSLPAAGAGAQTPPSGVRTAQAAQPVATEVSAQRRVRRLRVYPNYEPGPDGVYPHYFPGPNAVRICNATYVQEYRPSGTVIVPRMSCVWRPG